MAAVPHVGRASDVSSSTTHQLYEQYGRQIYAYCLHRLRSREEAEDAVQTTFLNAFRALQKGTQTQFEQAWLFKIAHNVCFERAESSGRRLQVESPSDLHVLQETAPAHAAQDPEQLIGIEAALEAMPANQRKAILLREWQGLSYREIGEELGLSQASVEMLIFRARRSLATALEQPQPEQAKKRRVGGLGLNVGSLVTALKTLFTGGAAMKAVAVAVTAGAVAVTGSKPAIHAVLHRHAQPHATVAASAAKTPAVVLHHAVASVLSVHRVAKKHRGASQKAPRPLTAAPLAAAPMHAAHAAAPAIDEPSTTAAQTTPSAPPAAPAPSTTPTAQPTPTPTPVTPTPAPAPAPTSSSSPKPKGKGGGTSTSQTADAPAAPSTPSTDPAPVSAPTDPGPSDAGFSPPPAAGSPGQGDGGHHGRDQGNNGGQGQQPQQGQGQDQGQGNNPGSGSGSGNGSPPPQAPDAGSPSGTDGGHHHDGGGGGQGSDGDGQGLAAGGNGGGDGHGHGHGH